MPHQTKSQILIATIIVLMATLGIGAIVLLFSRSVRETTQQQLDLEKAYSLAESGLKVGVRCAKNDPLDCSLYNQTSNVTLGGGNYNLTLVQNAHDTGAGKTFIKVDITSKGQYGKSTHILTDSLQMLTTPLTTWAKTFQVWTTLDADDYLFWIQQTTDNGYLLGSDVYPGGLLNSDFCAIKTSSTGAVEWCKSYGDGSDNLDGIRAGQQTNDGGYILGGCYKSKDLIQIIKTNSTGDITWSRRIGNTTLLVVNSAESVIQTADNGYITAGFSGYWGALNKDLNFLVVKINSTGGLDWRRAWGGTQNGRHDALRSVLEVTGVGYVFLGESNHYSNSPGNNADFNLIFTNTTGVPQGMRVIRYGGTGDETPGARVISTTPDGGYLFGGVSNSTDLGINNDTGILLIKTNSTGNVTWAKTYDGPARDELRSIRQTSDGGFILEGGTTSITSNGDIFLIKTNNEGNITWAKYYNNENNFDINVIDDHYALGCLLETADGYLIGGTTYSPPPPIIPLPDTFVMKVDKTGSIDNCAIDNNFPSLVVTNATSSLLVNNTMVLNNVTTTISFQNVALTATSRTVLQDRSPCPNP